MRSKIKKVTLGVAIVGLTLAGLVSKFNNDCAIQRAANSQVALERKCAFTPLINDILYEGIDPFGYDAKSKLKHFIPSLLFGREHKVPERDDAWRLYLGKSQVNNTFSISKYSPQGSKEVCYKINDFFDHYLSFGDPAEQIRGLHEQSKRGVKILFGDFKVMGGYTIGVSKDEKGSFLYYHDVWDLDVPLERNGGFFGKPFTIYDRLYFDESTHNPERPINKAVSSIDDLERM